MAVEIEFDWDVLWPIGEIEVVEFWGNLGWGILRSEVGQAEVLNEEVELQVGLEE